MIGPGFITANVDNDAGGIFTYSQAGAQFGYSLLWTMIPITIALVVVQEMASRMGAVTGKGLSDLIREEFGFRVTFLLMLALVVTNFGNVVARVRRRRQQPRAVRLVEVHRRAAGGGDGLGAGRARHLRQHREDLPGGVGVLRLLHRRRPAGASGLEGGGVGDGQPPLGGPGIRNYGYLFMVIGLVGTTIAPWMQFYLQASIVEKGITARQYAASRWDVILGCIFTDVVAWFIIVACAATLYATGHHDIGTRGATRRRRCGRWPASTRTCCSRRACSTRRSSPRRFCPSRRRMPSAKGLGFESGLDKKFHEAPVFYWLYTLLIVTGAGVLLVPRLPLVYVTVLSQVANGVVLPFVLIFMLMLTNDRELMGEHVNSRGFNIVAWTTVVVMIVLTLAMVITQR